MISEEEQAIEAGRRFLVGKGIEVLDIARIKKLPGAFRVQYVPSLDSDFWMITFNRTVPIPPSGETEVEREIFAAYVETYCHEVTVIVELDGSVIVI